MKSRAKLDKIGKNLSKNIEMLPLILYSLTVGVALFFLINTSLKSPMEYMVNKAGFPNNWTLGNFVEVISKTYFLRWIFNSTVITIGSVGIAALTSILLSYGFSSFRFKFRNTAFSIVSAFMVIPPIVLIGPLHELLSNLRMTDTYWGTISVYIIFIIPFWTFFLTRFFMSVNKSVIDSARIDGCTDLILLFKIILPLTKAPIATLAIVSTLYVWNDLLISLVFLQKDALRPLMVGLTIFTGHYYVNVPGIFAGLIISVIPMLIFYMFVVRVFEPGVLSGSTKE